MESFARRGIRTTVAVAGLAALGVGLAAPAFAVPDGPNVSGVGGTQPGSDDPGTPTGFAKASDTLAALPGAFAFQPPAEHATTSDAASSAPDVQAQPDATDSDAEPAASDSTASDSTEADSTEPAAADASPGLLPTVPGSPVNAQTTPRVEGLEPGSALQGLDSANMF